MPSCNSGIPPLPVRRILRDASAATSGPASKPSARRRLQAEPGSSHGRFGGSTRSSTRSFAAAARRRRTSAALRRA